MAVTDYKTPGTCANVDRDGKAAWADPDNAKTTNDSYANGAVAKDDYNDWLRCTNFGFSTSDIPSGATIDGIEVKIEHKGHLSNSDYICDSALYLRKTSGQIGDNKASAAHWPTSDEEVTYGASNDTWNSGLADTDIRSSDFGVDLSAFHPSGGMASVLYAYIDCVWIRIHYTEAGGPTTGWNQIVYTSEPPTANAWNQVKQDAGAGFVKIWYDSD